MSALPVRGGTKTDPVVGIKGEGDEGPRHEGAVGDKLTTLEDAPTREPGVVAAAPIAEPVVAPGAGNEGLGSPGSEPQLQEPATDDNGSSEGGDSADEPGLMSWWNTRSDQAFAESVEDASDDRDTQTRSPSHEQSVTAVSEIMREKAAITMAAIGNVKTDALGKHELPDAIDSEPTSLYPTAAATPPEGDDFSDSSHLDLQAATDRQAQVTQVMSNVLKQQHETRQAVIRNIKGTDAEGYDPSSAQTELTQAEVEEDFEAVLNALVESGTPFDADELVKAFVDAELEAAVASPEEPSLLGEVTQAEVPDTPRVRESADTEAGPLSASVDITSPQGQAFHDLQTEESRLENEIAQLDDQLRELDVDDFIDRDAYDAAKRQLFEQWDELRDELAEIREEMYELPDLDRDADGLSDADELDDYGTDPTQFDTDGDGLSDSDEVVVYGTDPTRYDTDSDLLSDGDEIDAGTDPFDPDSDNDWLLDGDEVVAGTDPLDIDTDGDGLADERETNFHGTDPDNPDTDGDGLSDGEEVGDKTGDQFGSNITDPNNPDTDADGLSDGDEMLHGTDPNDWDTDGDSLSDGDEVHDHFTDPTRYDTDADGLSDADEIGDYPTDPLDPDSDGDGVLDGREVVHGTDPNDPSDHGVDTDGDGLLDLEEDLYGTDPLDPDTDNDDLSDGSEIFEYGTDPTLGDTDSDWMSDGDEIIAGTNPNVHDTDGDEVETSVWGEPDTDKDGIDDLEEVARGTDPTNPDSDMDGLLDGEEVSKYGGFGTDPLHSDTDGDRLPDGEEVARGTDPTNPDTDKDGLWDADEVYNHGTDPTNPDTDKDGLLDGEELSRGTDPTNPDTDKDGLLDGDEVSRGTDPTNPDTDKDGLDDGKEVHKYASNPLNPDTDGDGLSDGEEIALGTSPFFSDSDFDGLSDLAEVRLGTDPLDSDTDGDQLTDAVEIFEYGTDPTNSDTDHDGLSDGKEVLVYGTKPLEFDSDGDGLSDGTEVLQVGTDPMDPDTDGDGLLDGDDAEPTGPETIGETLGPDARADVYPSGGPVGLAGEVAGVSGEVRADLDPGVSQPSGGEPRVPDGIDSGNGMADLLRGEEIGDLSGGFGLPEEDLGGLAGGVGTPADLGEPDEHDTLTDESDLRSDTSPLASDATGGADLFAGTEAGSRDQPLDPVESVTRQSDDDLAAADDRPPPMTLEEAMAGDVDPFAQHTEEHVDADDSVPGEIDTDTLLIDPADLPGGESGDIVLDNTTELLREAGAGEAEPDDGVL